MATPALLLDASEVRASARQLAARGRQVVDLSFDVADQWERLAPYYQAPESADLLSKMRSIVVPLGQRADEVVGAVAQALVTFADAAEPIAAELRSLMGQDQADSEVATRAERLLYEFAALEVDCANAIRAAIGLGSADLRGLFTFAPDPYQPGFWDYLLYGAQLSEAVDGIVGRGLAPKNRPPGRRTGPGELPEFPMAEAPLPPLPSSFMGAVVGDVVAPPLQAPPIVGYAETPTGPPPTARPAELGQPLVGDSEGGPGVWVAEQRQRGQADQSFATGVEPLPGHGVPEYEVRGGPYGLAVTFDGYRPGGAATPDVYQEVKGNYGFLVFGGSERVGTQLIDWERQAADQLSVLPPGSQLDWIFTRDPQLASLAQENFRRAGLNVHVRYEPFSR